MNLTYTLPDGAAPYERLTGWLAEATAERDRLRAVNAELRAALEAFLEAQDSPAPRDLLTLAAIQASNALAKAAA